MRYAKASITLDWPLLEKYKLVPSEKILRNTQFFFVNIIINISNSSKMLGMYLILFFPTVNVTPVLTPIKLANYEDAMAKGSNGN